MAQCGIALGAAVIGACGTPADATAPPDEDGGTGGSDPASGGSLGANGGSSASGAGGSAGTGSPAGSGGTLQIEPPVGGSGGQGSGLTPVVIGTPPTAGDCRAAGALLFCDQVLWNVAPAARVLYTWTTAEQLDELRRDQILLTRTERADLGRGYAFTSLDDLAARGSAPENQLLAKLSSELFTKVRYAWPHPWATRMGWPGEDYGDRLVRITLKADAWIVVVVDGQGMAVIDLANRVVPAADALAQAERIGAVYFVRTEVDGQETFSSCAGGYREFIVGNPAMVEEWAVETDEIHARITADAARFEAFLERVRTNELVFDARQFNVTVACSWDLTATGEIDTYLRSLAIPSEYYVPRPAEIVTIAETLRASLFEPNPLVVRPGA